jgi:hypothetical protein
METEPHQPHPARSRRIDLVLALSAIAISMFSALMALENSRAAEKMVGENERMVQASTWPFITIYQSARTEGGERMFRMTIENDGVGPAKIETVKLAYKSKPVTDYDLLAALVARDAGYAGKRDFLQSSANPVLPARQNVSILMVQAPPSSPELIRAFIKARRDITLSVCYCSLFNECWTADNRPDGPPKRVRQCQAAG